jgi:uncharacterized protein
VPIRHRVTARAVAHAVAHAVAPLFVLVGAARAAGAQVAPDRLVPPSPAPSGYVADGGPVLDDAARARLNTRIADVRRRTGGDVGVAVLRDLDGRAPADVGVAIYRAWRVGAVDSLGGARRHLGALLLIVPKELSPSRRGECWITTGLGAEATLRDAVAGAICRDAVVPELRARRYEAALAAGVDAVGAALARASDDAGHDPARGGEVLPGRTAHGAEPAAEGRAPPRLPWQYKLLFLAALAYAGSRAVAAWRRRQPRPCPRGHGPMTRLTDATEAAALTDGQRAEQRVGSIDYDVWACARCDARAVLPYHQAQLRAHERCPGCAHWTAAVERRTVRAATTSHEGLVELTSACAHCGWGDVQQHHTSRLTKSTSGSAGSSGGRGSGDAGGGSSSFGGDGATAGGGGGASY